MNILVTGGSGYIGSVIAKRLMEKGHYPFILDHNQSHLPGSFNCDLSDSASLDRIFKQKRIDAVIHLAGFIEVNESMKEPLKYYKNNYCNTINLLDAMMRNNVNKMIYASSAAVYGQPEIVPVTEDSIQKPERELSHA